MNATNITKDHQQLYLKAKIHFEKKEDELACAAIEEILSNSPDNLPALKLLATIRTTIGQHVKASAHYAKTVLLEPGDPINYLNFGVCLHKLGQLDEAIACFDRALELKSDLADALSNKGAALRDKHEFESALGCYQAAIQLDERRLDDFLNYALVLCDLDFDDEALEVCENALLLGARPCHGNFIKGFILAKLMRSEEAKAAYLKSLSIKPDFPEASWNLSHIYLRQGDYERGWPLFEYRWHTSTTKLTQRKFPKPKWDGFTSLLGKTILITTEQGLGDTIQFCRYGLLLEKIGAKVIWEVQKPLVNLIKTLSTSIVVIAEGEIFPDFDVHCSQMSLPAMLRTNLETVPAKSPYLFSHPSKSMYWSKKLGMKNKPRIGLVWSGGFHKDRPDTWTWNKRRNINLINLKCLAQLDCELFSIQKGMEAEKELERYKANGWNGQEITDYTQDLNDFEDTAALISQLDLVVSVDTSTAHLAGALGKPVYLLNRFDSCWRWIDKSSQTPWYPTMRIFQQTKPGCWQEAIVQLLSNITSLKFN